MKPLEVKIIGSKLVPPIAIQFIPSAIYDRFTSGVYYLAVKSVLSW